MEETRGLPHHSNVLPGRLRKLRPPLRLLDSVPMPPTSEADQPSLSTEAQSQFCAQKRSSVQSSPGSLVLPSFLPTIPFACYDLPGAGAMERPPNPSPLQHPAVHSLSLTLILIFRVGPRALTQDCSPFPSARNGKLRLGGAHVLPKATQPGGIWMTSRISGLANSPALLYPPTQSFWRWGEDFNTISDSWSQRRFPHHCPARPCQWGPQC